MSCVAVAQVTHVGDARIIPDLPPRGEFEAFERHWAELLGKVTAVFMPSGTLANQLALRALAGTKRRVIVPDVSHIYNDTGDACQTLSALTLMPLARSKAATPLRHCSSRIEQ